MGGWARAAFLAAGLAVGATATAGDGASPKPPPPPEVDFSGLPDSAAVRPSNGDKPHQVEARLLADRDVITPGEPFRLGVLLVQDDGWHTYWKSPGDIGLPTDITWELPEGATSTPYAYPVPQRFEQSDLVSYGYEDQVLLFTEVVLPEGTPSGMLDLGASAGWLVCEVSCIPGSADLTLPLEVAAEPAASPWAPLFDHFAAQHPTDAPDTLEITSALSASAVRPNEPFRAAFHIRATDAELADPGDSLWPTFTPITGFDWMLNDVSVRAHDGGLLVVMEGETFEPDPLPTDATFGGLIQVQVDGEWVRTEVSAPMPWAPAGGDVTPIDSPLLPGPSAQAGGGAAGTDAPGGGSAGSDAAGVQAATPSPASSGSLPLMLAFAFLGGVLLNVMPCVFPVLSLKLFGLVSHADGSPAEKRASGLAYTAGILASFWALAAGVLVMKSTVGAVGWGFQFQSPTYVAALATIVFVFGLSLFGVFDVPALGADAAAGAASSRSGRASDFLNGVFATLVATPCTAPFLGPAVGFAFAQSTAVVALFFTVIGLGLAAPFLAVAFVPALFRLMPQPGPWMDTFKQLMGFTLIATTIWMVDILAAQVGPDGATGFLAFLAVVGLGAWIFGRWGGVEQSGGRQLGAFGAALGVALLGGWSFLDLDEAAAEVCDDGSLAETLDFSHEVPWQPFSESRVEALAGKPVFIDFTADWCLTCKVNERTVLETSTVRDAMKDHGVVPLKADWTRRDPVITEWLARYDRAGVPFYLVLPADPDARPIPLPEVITADTVVAALEQAADGAVAASGP